MTLLDLVLVVLVFPKLVDFVLTIAVVCTILVLAVRR